MTSCLVYLDLYLDELSGQIIDVYLDESLNAVFNIYISESSIQSLDLYLDELDAPGLDIDFVSLTDITQDFNFKELVADNIVELYLCESKVVELSLPVYKTNFIALRGRLNKGDIFIDLEGKVRLVIPSPNILLDFSIVYSYLRRAF